MPRDSDKHNDSPRGRRDRGGPKGSFKGRTGKPRGPEKKFAKRGLAGKGDRDERPSRGDRDSRPFRRREEGDAPRREFGDRPRFKRDDRGREDRGERSFKPRGDRPFKAHGDRPKFASDERAPRGERSERRFEDRKFSRGGSDRPRKEFGRDRDFEGKDRKRDFGDRKRSFGDRPRDRDDRPRKNFGKSLGKDFGGRDRSDEKPWRQRDDRREGGRGEDRPRFSRRRDEGGEDRPRFPRSREERFGDDRPRFGRSREDRAGGRSDWHEHPRSEGRFRDRPRRDNEDDSQIFTRRPAFGGRGAYRERDRDFEGRPRRDEAPKPKKAGERIAKVLARAGLASRRDAEEMVTQGRVTVNGRVINSPALDVTQNDVVAVDGKPLPPRERTRLFLYHKPRGLMTTHDDPEGRPTVFDNLPEGLPRLISVGRLDFNTEGLLLLTNDGGLARTLELPDTGWLRRYRVRAHGDVTQAQLDELKNGIEVEGVKYGPIEATLERDQGANVWLVFAIREGKNREVRNVCAHLGLEVNRLIRVSYGPFQLGEIPEGQVDEIKSRVLREQLGDKVIEKSGAQFDVPQKSSSRDHDDAPREKKPVSKRAVINDRKGRRVLVQRTGSEEARERNEWEASGYGPPRRPKRGYHGKRDLKPRED
ncbi:MULTISPECIES: pseudouridine synthase [unclassified Bradyrhizobium]|uniref:pseudouridine synthase n=1 Tax=unclassified Bradyrhizobium TaxID=2631580 RepID=UPI00247B1F0C|nr:MULTISPECIES: pseudouridine synthase [unclassified Bradyrhizobium]WGR72495.1 pseudouridine synthase [Bradyrhizobium sp. ISRA426]WGR77328.1 pseudouridine synthase [Bradyrhizobium sp. ISRA430]WGR87734.1 pseudouridine synthase [Bradyrhizobium sp. ISRA432]